MGIGRLIEKVSSLDHSCVLSGWNNSVVRVADALLMRKHEIIENVIAACNGIAHVYVKEVTHLLDIAEILNLIKIWKKCEG